MTRNEMKFCLVVVLHFGLNSFNECPLSPLVIVRSWHHCRKYGKVTAYRLQRKYTTNKNASVAGSNERL